MLGFPRLRIVRIDIDFVKDYDDIFSAHLWAVTIFNHFLKGIPMKLRTGFVSNSSTSSFCVFGVEVGFEELARKLGVEVPEIMTVPGCWHSYDKRQKTCPQCGAPKTKEVDFQTYIDNNGEEDGWGKLLDAKLGEYGLSLNCYNDECEEGGNFVGCGTYGKGQELIDQLTKVNESCKKLFGKEATTHSGTYAC